MTPLRQQMIAALQLSAKAVGKHTASTIPVATGTVLSVRSIKPSSGYTTTSKNNSPGRTFSSPSASLRPYAPSSARISASPTRPCLTPRLSPSNGLPKTHGSSVQTSQVSPASCIPGEDSSSTTPTSITSSLGVDFQRTAPPGSPPEPTSLSPSKPSDPTGPIESAPASIAAGDRGEAN